MGNRGYFLNSIEAKTRCQAVIAWKTGPAADDCSKKIKDILSKAPLKDIWSKFDSEICQAPPIMCYCCNEGYGGAYSTATRDVKVCWDSAKNNDCSVLSASVFDVILR